MKTSINKLPLHNIFLYCCLGLILGCNSLSEKETDQAAGVNGGFETTKNDLPVNWLMYSPNTVPDSNFTIELDTINFKEGKQSLRFNVKKCSNVGGRLSPGFTNQFEEVGGFQGENNYKVSFWIKNQESKYRIRAGGVSVHKGEMKILLEQNESINNWKKFEYNINVPEDMELRLELNIIEPGVFWIDNINIETM